MDATILTVIGTGLTGIATALTLFAALWRVQGKRFDTMDQRMHERFEASDKRWTERFEAVDQRFEMAETHSRERFEMAETHSRERFEAAETANRERFEMAEKLNRERFEAMDAKWTERFEAMDRRFETVERQGQATHAAVCTLNGRLDDLYRHLLGAAAPPAQPGPAAG